jgi:hypothetical protein
MDPSDSGKREQPTIQRASFAHVCTVLCTTTVRTWLVNFIIGSQLLLPRLGLGLGLRPNVPQGALVLFFNRDRSSTRLSVD